MAFQSASGPASHPPSLLLGESLFTFCAKAGVTDLNTLGAPRTAVHVARDETGSGDVGGRHR